MFEPDIWERVPFHFWSVVIFVFGCIVGSFLNVCIHRMPRDQSIISPPSHCPHCGYSIPWYLNIPLVTWLYLGGKCANCKAPISIRYFLVELLTGVLFLGCWLKFGHQSPALVLPYCVLLAGFVTATFIDFEHFIIPDEITIGGIFVGFFLAVFIPSMMDSRTMTQSILQSGIGIVVGAGLIESIRRAGKLIFGKHQISLPQESKIIFTETNLHLPDQEIPLDEMFGSNSDTLVFHASKLELIDRCYANVEVRLSPKKLQIGDEEMDPEPVKYIEATTNALTMPREVMGFGDVKFMAAIGAFLGWPAVLFSLMVSSIIGSVVGMTLIGMKKKEWSSRIPYGPYIAIAATLWVFVGREFIRWWVTR